MVQGYYTLEEASRILGMDSERLNQMAQRREIRAFADRGTWRFRTQDVDEMARRLGMGSAPELQLGEASKPASSARPKSGPKSPVRTPPAEEGTFDLASAPGRSGEEEHDIVIESPSGQKSPRPSPTPKPGSDSDVHLVFDAGGDLPGVDDSDVRLEEPTSGLGRRPESTPKVAKPSGPKSPPPRKSVTPPSSQLDSGVRLVPMEDDEVSLPIGQQPPLSGTDSDIRLAPDSDISQRGSRSGAKAEDLSQTTEDINLDEEIRKAEEMAQAKKPRSKVKPRSDPRRPQPPLEATSQMPETGQYTPVGGGSKPSRDETEEIPLDSSDDFILSDEPASQPSSKAGVKSGPKKAEPASPKDSSSDSLEFELSLEPEGTPQPKLESDIESSGEFELTLDESGSGSSAVEGGSGVSAEEVFETDFDMPAVGEEAKAGSGEPDTELESSDFDLSLGEDSSQVVALEGEEADEGAETAAHRAPGEEAEDAEVEDIDQLLGEGEAGELEGEEEALVGRRPVAVAAPAEWGILPIALLIPCVVVTLVLSLMSFELVHSLWGYQQPNKASGMLIKGLNNTLGGEKIPD